MEAGGSDGQRLVLLVTVRAFKVLKERVLGGLVMAKMGDIVYEQLGHDYGLANDDTSFTGEQHVSVTLKETGDYPGFTIPLVQLEEL